jgi:hypothetical protein
VLFNACARAPHWVQGYHNFIFDAMCLFEGCEMIPSTQIYNNILTCFAKACDPGAIEYYFWEMRYKKIPQDIVTYNCFFDGLARAQSVGLRHYGNKVIKQTHLFRLLHK